MSTLSPADAVYARNYQAQRARRCSEKAGIVLPLEVLIDRESGTPHLSVSFSATSSADLYVPQRVPLVRAVRITRRWLVVPWTVGKVFDRHGFLETFGDLVEDTTVDGEPFWVLRAASGSKVKERIRTLELDESFRAAFEHEYLPDGSAAEAAS